MVCAGEAVNPSSSSRSNSDLEIGCLIDLATGLVTFTANGKELSTVYQVELRLKFHLFSGPKLPISQYSLASLP